jgi:hemerythrin-like metal-binding protein
MIFQLMDIQRCLISGHTELDAQQAEFIERGNRYLRAYASGMQNAILEPTLTYLSDYSRNHFQVQEVFMKKNNYPALDKHTLHHGEYIKKIAQIFKSLLSWKSTQNHDVYANLSLNMCMIISDWFEFHILNDDVRLNEYIIYEIRGKRRS